MTIIRFVTLESYLTSEFRCVMYEADDNNAFMKLTWDFVGNKLIVVANTLYVHVKILLVFHIHDHYLDSIRKNKIWSWFLEGLKSTLGKKHVEVK